MYIHSTYAVSPQVSFDALLANPERYTGERFACKEPDYTKYIDPKLIRRMSRIIKMGASAAMECLQAAQEKNPDAIVTGTAYGCLADTDQFLTRMVEFKEELLSPTAFIQSTHNTVGAQIALQLKCHNYNNTYVHRGNSFEAALLDAVSLINEGDAEKVLIGGVDEIIEHSHAILRRFDLYKTDGASEMLIGSGTRGTIAGEGAAFFLLDKNKPVNAMAKLDAMQTFYKPTGEITDLIESFMAGQGISVNDIDLVITGDNGDNRYSRHYNHINRLLFENKPAITYKQYCGEYPTSSAFALWLASNIISTGKVPENTAMVAPRKILIYNNYKLNYPSLYLLSVC
ncbi:beta-ketoacyl synthase chain length factor [Niabella soli]|uniref:3-oxoacyl-ACP synthase n=1 Tax=Niabella soli DSM 19437 TaxID=929713 RepID=W0EYK3_9BACT|nr:beta-ketoacyl synthase chain length factor [Niabella soli]AHF15900.1 3-oxoacyl-ACP synthase [Niabella soli DSM 19437]